MTTLVFTLGPVQSFIAQSRRTGDGWVGSFLLSYLSCHAALALERHGEILDPELRGIPLHEALQRKTTHVEGDLRVAGCPNTFVVALHAGADPRAAGDAARGAVETHWHEIESKVWAKLPDEARSAHAEKLWQRQTAGFWETCWAWGDDSNAAWDALTARKELRPFAALREEGERCTLCAEREALWHGEPVRRGSLRADVRDYWTGWDAKLRGSGVARSAIKDDGSERLCAVCVIKRLASWLDGNPLSDLWRDKDAIFPSTSTMATLRAKATLVRLAYGDSPDAQVQTKLEAFVHAVKGAGERVGARAIPPTSFRAWAKALGAVRAAQQRKTAETFLGFDGDVLVYGPSVQREHAIDKDADLKLRCALGALLRAVPKDAADAAPSIYWALVAMDGDHMGALLRRLAQAGGMQRVRAASAVVNAFARHVPKIVERHDGRLVYAGGDDALVLFPVDAALPAAEELRCDFARRFGDWLATLDPAERAGIAAPTLSAALVYTHHQTPLGRVIERAHKLLKDEAKGRAQRNAVAIEVRTRAGDTHSFAARWQSSAGESFAVRIEGVVEGLRGRQVASRFLYELQGLEPVLNDSQVLGGERHDDRVRFVASLAEKTRLATAEDAPELAARLLAAADLGYGERLNLSPLVFARFLSTGGRETR